MSLHQEEFPAFRRLPRIHLLTGPTPIERCDRLRAALPAEPRIFVKRDDLTGYLVGGNKIRKLEYTLAEALARKTTAVVTIGSVRSNHARITAMVARRLGLRCVLVLNGGTDEPPSGNHLVMTLLGVEIVPVGRREDRLPMMAETAARLEREGEQVFTIPLGASDEIGSFGLAAAFEEVVRFEESAGLRFDAIITASSSGGTQAGLEVGKRLFGRTEMRILGVSPDDPAAGIRDIVLDVADRMLSRLGLHERLRPGDIRVDEGFIGPGYGLATPGSEEAFALFAGTEGLLLDPVYTNKAGAALIDYCRRGCFGPRENVLFWHTGGLVGLFG